MARFIVKFDTYRVRIFSVICRKNFLGISSRDQIPIRVFSHAERGGAFFSLIKLTTQHAHMLTEHQMSSCPDVRINARRCRGLLYRCMLQGTKPNLNQFQRARLRKNPRPTSKHTLQGFPTRYSLVFPFTHTYHNVYCILVRKNRSR
jgi:hypothetical protein